jgi:hypothetical protein
MNKCPYCGDNRFSNLNILSLKGHLAYCKKRNVILNNSELNSNENYDEIDDPILDLNDALPIFDELSNEFLKKQNLRLSEWGLDNIMIGHCALTTGERRIGNLRIYLLIAKFVTHCFGMSGEDAKDLVLLLKLVSHINGKEIPMPSKYITIQNRLLSSLNFLKISLEVFKLEMPASLFTETIVRQMPKAEGVISNILDIAGIQYILNYLNNILFNM